MKGSPLSQLLIGMLLMLGLPGGVVIVVYRRRLARLARMQNSILSEQTEDQLARGILVPGVGFLGFGAIGIGLVVGYLSQVGV